MSNDRVSLFTLRAWQSGWDFFFGACQRPDQLRQRGLLCQNPVEHFERGASLRLVPSLELAVAPVWREPRRGAGSLVPLVEKGLVD
jgi:hypothetical protein